VGSEVLAGRTYRTRVQSNGCYWERLSGLGGTLDEIIANDIRSGVSVVTIGSDDVAFESSRCGTWTTNLAAVTSSSTAPLAMQGVFIVGTDIAPGVWRAEGTENCYWARLSGFSGELKDIIANDIGPGPAIVEVSASDAGFETSNCGTWVKIQ
jgi:hypothetical protein